MTNFEFYKEDILKFIDNDINFGLFNDKIVDCNELKCGECDFCGDDGACTTKKFKWLYEEYIERQKITKKERLFCELMEAGWIARDRNGRLFYYSLYPEKTLNSNSCWYPTSASINIVNFKISECHNLDTYKSFSFVKWEDEQAWSIEDLLKLEVEE